jgi:hypothetical protein
MRISIQSSLLLVAIAELVAASTAERRHPWGRPYAALAKQTSSRAVQTALAALRGGDLSDEWDTTVADSDSPLADGSNNGDDDDEELEDEEEEYFDAQEEEIGLAKSAASSSSGDYNLLLESVQSKALINAQAKLKALRHQVIDQQEVVGNFGTQAQALVQQALEDFASSAPKAGSASQRASLSKQLGALEAALDAPLQVLFMHQLQALRQTALQRFKSATTGGGSPFQAMLQADTAFAQAAEGLIRPGASWTFARERAFLQTLMTSLAEASEQSQSRQLQSAQQQQTAMQFLQSQQQMIQQLQMQLYGQSSPWNVGVAYRIPDTNFNVQGSYQQGRANVQLSCVPDEYAPFLGPNGFTNGVGPGNLGLSLNLSI